MSLSEKRRPCPGTLSWPWQVQRCDGGNNWFLIGRMRLLLGLHYWLRIWKIHFHTHTTYWLSGGLFLGNISRTCFIITYKKNAYPASLNTRYNWMSLNLCLSQKLVVYPLKYFHLQKPLKFATFSSVRPTVKVIESNRTLAYSHFNYNAISCN